MFCLKKAISLATAALAMIGSAAPLIARESETTTSVALLAAPNQISNVMADYAFFVDSKQFSNLTQVFAPNGSCYFPKPYPEMQGSAEIIEVLQNATVNVHSQHLLGTSYINVINATAATSHS